MTPKQATSSNRGKPLSLEHALYLSLQRLASELHQETAELFKEAGLSAPQFNILRILRGAGEGGLPCNDISERLIARAPDMTRLLDRMEQQGLVTRNRSEVDRRIVAARITEAGLALLAGLDAPLLNLHQQQFAPLGEEKSARLLELLEAARAKPQP